MPHDEIENKQHSPYTGKASVSSLSLFFPNGRLIPLTTPFFSLRGTTSDGVAVAVAVRGGRNCPADIN